MGGCRYEQVSAFWSDFRERRETFQCLSDASAWCPNLSVDFRRRSRPGPRLWHFSYAGCLLAQVVRGLVEIWCQHHEHLLSTLAPEDKGSRQQIRRRQPLPGERWLSRY